jgi:hypothetical protein
MATINEILGGQNILGLLDPTGALQTDAEQRARNAGLLNFAFGALQASRGQPGQGRPGLAQVIGQAGPAGVAGYQQSFDKTLGDLLRATQIRQSLAEANAPKYGTIKEGELLYQIPKGGGAPTPIQFPNMPTRRIDFDAQTQAFIQNMFGKPFDQLSAEQQRKVIEFAQAPDEKQFSDLAIKRIEALKDQPQSAEALLTLPKTRSQILTELLQRQSTQPGLTVTPIPPVAPATPPVPPAAPPTAPVTPAVPQARPTATTEPSGAPVTTEMIRTSGIVQLPTNMAEKPLGRDEIPLINSKGISPKQKSELEIGRPQAFTSVETALNTTRQIRSEINRLLEDSNFNLAFGFGGETTSKIYTPAANIRAKLDQIKNQLFVEGITALRNASPTGAGVGSVTNQEGGRFENLRGALVQFQSADQARAELTRIEKELEASERRIQNGFSRVYGTTQFDVSPLYTPQQKGNLRGILGLPQPLPRRQ